MKPWLRWLSKAGVQQWDMYPEPTELLWIGCLTDSTWILRFKSGTLIPNTRLQTYWRVEQSTSFVQHQPFRLSLLCQNFSLISCTERMAKRMQDQKEENRIVAKSRPTRRTWSFQYLQLLHLWTVRLRREARGYSNLQVDRLDCQWNLVQTQVKIPISTQCRVLKDGKGMLNCSLAQGNLKQLHTKDIQKIPKLHKCQKITK